MGDLGDRDDDFIPQAYGCFPAFTAMFRSFSKTRSQSNIDMTLYNLVSTSPSTVPSNFTVSFFAEAIESLLAQSHFQVILKIMTFLYSHMDLFSPPQRRQLLAIFLSHSRFYTLFLHWEQEVRTVFHHLIVHKFSMFNRASLPFYADDVLIGNDIRRLRPTSLSMSGSEIYSSSMSNLSTCLGSGSMCGGSQTDTTQGWNGRKPSSSRRSQRISRNSRQSRDFPSAQRLSQFNQDDDDVPIDPHTNIEKLYHFRLNTEKDDDAAALPRRRLMDMGFHNEMVAMDLMVASKIDTLLQRIGEQVCFSLFCFFNSLFIAFVLFLSVFFFVVFIVVVF
jgi:hypothetical protein